ncbi:hypothetical protein [Nitrosomonas supralitoralis]|uniref:Uncharacterized protein n=1 Tax=Nitrosomonas supralitoralis TaxID=2116706 RepID=A0A2P7NWI5_9PROT|nr:hypothetical protein [Nitrosomonas supralitoralis]PSJ17844.1 hypothetical protein C7H79_06215 [Nitrosomonas supralitoralis]
MSRLWRDQIQVFLAPGRLDWVRLKCGLKPVQTDKVTVFFEPAANAPIWNSAVDELDKVLTEAARTEVSVILSNHFLRYATLPPQNEIASPEEVKSYAEFRMREVYAERVDSWELSISDWNPVDGAVCAAIPRELIMQLEQMASSHGCTIKVIEPYMASVYDRWQTHLKGEKIYLAVIETGRICIAITHHGKWQSIRNQRISHSAARDLLAALDQEVIWSGAKEAMEFVYLFAPEHPEMSLPQDSGWCIISLPAGKKPALAHYPSAPINHTELNQCPA